KLEIRSLRRYPTHHSCPGDGQNPPDAMQLRGCSQYFIGGPTVFLFEAQPRCARVCSRLGTEVEQPGSGTTRICGGAICQPASRANIFRLDTVPGNPSTEGEIQQPSPSHRQVHALGFA